MIFCCVIPRLRHIYVGMQLPTSWEGTSETETVQTLGKGLGVILMLGFESNADDTMYINGDTRICSEVGEPDLLTCFISCKRVSRDHSLTATSYHSKLGLSLIRGLTTVGMICIGPWTLTNRTFWGLG